MPLSFNTGTGSGGAGSSTTTLSCVYSQEGAAEVYRAIMVNSSSPIYNQLINLASGANTITIPSTSAGVIIQLPANNATAVTLKGVAGDTGILISKTAPTTLEFDNPPAASFVLNAAAIINLVRFVWF